MKLCVLIPVKTFARAKQRLGPFLNPEEREALAEAMFRDVLDQVASSPAVAAVTVITADGQAARIASARGARVFQDANEEGESEAVAPVLVRLRRSGAPSALVLPADIPLIRSRDLELLEKCADDCEAPEFGLLVPSSDRDGTNALLLSPPDLITPSFGRKSFSRHAALLAARGAECRTIENENIGLDIDKADDLRRLLSRNVSGRTHATLLNFQRTAARWSVLGD